MKSFEVKPCVVPGQFNFDGSFPLVLTWQGDDDALTSVTDWISNERDRLSERLGRHGAILLRGFPLQSDQDFDAAIQAYGMDSFTYADSLSNAVRVNRTERVFTANEAPPSVSIFLHHEMAQTPLFPSMLFFFCEAAPTRNGQTPLCRSDVLLQRLMEQAPEFVSDCEHLGVKYSNVMPGEDDAESGQGRSWRSTLAAGDRASAEKKLRQLGYSWQWLEDDTLRATTPVLPAVRQLRDGRKVFFNQLIAAYRGWKDARNDPGNAICFGDDSVIAADAMQLAIDLADDLTFDLAWQQGDVALVDNFLVMHGRRPYEGTRRVLASLIANDGRRLAAA